MAAYMIAQIKVTDPTRYKKYVESTLPTIEKYGGRFLARGGRTLTFEGPEETRRIVILEFPSLERAQQWYASEDYQTVKKLRVGAAEGKFVVVDGV
jgi:uncharacterized protein (DUF1330 family)